MNDLISRSALMERFEQVQGQCKTLAEHIFFDGVVAIVEAAPAVDAEPVRHGRMTNPTFNGVKPVCTGCHIAYDKDPYWNYCPNCGAKMDAEVEG